MAVGYDATPFSGTPSTLTLARGDSIQISDDDVKDEAIKNYIQHAVLRAGGEMPPIPMDCAKVLLKTKMIELDLIQLEEIPPTVSVVSRSSLP